MADNAGTTLFTGYPGFIGRRLVHRLLENPRSGRLVLLVEQAHAAAARAEFVASPATLEASTRPAPAPSSTTERHSSADHPACAAADCGPSSPPASSRAHFTRVLPTSTSSVMTATAAG